MKGKKAIIRSALIGVILAVAIIALLAQWPEYQDEHRVDTPDGHGGGSFYYVTGYDFSGLLKTAAIEAAIALIAFVWYWPRRFRKS